MTHKGWRVVKPQLNQLLADSKGPDQTARMHRLICAFAVHICPYMFSYGAINFMHVLWYISFMYCNSRYRGLCIDNRKTFCSVLRVRMNVWAIVIHILFTYGAHGMAHINRYVWKCTIRRAFSDQLERSLISLRWGFFRNLIYSKSAQWRQL